MNELFNGMKLVLQYISISQLSILPFNMSVSVLINHIRRAQIKYFCFSLPYKVSMVYTVTIRGAIVRRVK